ncbi:hypothetical protein BBP40_008760 [Aspergillus hancockii]|nr:hypothetical protein BBP40_008760 [Aspergillus hancockii]
MTILLAGSDPISTPNFNISKSAAKTWDQSMTFSVPAEAKSCSVMWSVPEERNFRAGDNALVRVYQDRESVGAADFTNWPQVAGEHRHTVGAAECREEMTFRLRLEKESEVFIEQDGETGWYVEYQC